MKKKSSKKAYDDGHGDGWSVGHRDARDNAVGICLDAYNVLFKSLVTKSGPIGPGDFRFAIVHQLSAVEQLRLKMERIGE